MITLREGEFTIREGRLTADICIEAGATLRNDAEVYTHTILSDGKITGSGTLWAHVTSKPIGGVGFFSKHVNRVDIDHPLHFGRFHGLRNVTHRFS